MAFTLVLLAADAASEKAGLPQFDFATFEPQIAWLILTLVVLYLVISMVIPKVGSVIDERDDKISGDIDKASRDQDQAASIKAHNDDVANKARRKAQTFLGEAKSKAAAELAAKTKKVDEELAAEAAASEARISAAKTKAIAEIEPVTRDAVKDIAQKIAGIDAQDAVVAGAVQAALAGTTGDA